MTAIVYRGFTGEQPRLEPHLLPPAASQMSLNCDFASGALVPTASGVLLKSLASNPIKGVHTEDGINFFSWPVETQTFISPIIEDVYNRMYFITPSEGLFRVGLKAEMSPFGPTPITTAQVGVPQPTVAPALTLVQRTTLAEYPSAAVSLTAWWESTSKQYGSSNVTLVATKPFLSYTFATPAKPTDLPADAVLCGRFSIKDTDGNALVSTVLRSGSSSNSKGLPGGLEISLSNDGAGAINIVWGVTDTRAYTYACENTWLEGGAPAPPALVSPTYMHDVKVVVVAPSFTGYRPFGKFNIYRTYGSGKTYIETVCTVDATGLVFTDASRKPTTVRGALESADWFPPPTGLQGMTYSPNGWFAGFKGNNLHLSEPYKPHAWPYIQKFPFAIRGVQAIQGGMVVTTAGGVYLLNGSYPAATSQMPLNLPQPGISQRSLASIDGAVAYACHDGFALVSGSDATMLASQKLFTRKVWRAQYGDILDDYSMAMSFYDGCLIATSSTRPKGFALRLDEDVGAYTRLDVRMDAMFLLPINDALYYSVGNNLYTFRSGVNQSFVWWGKDFIYQKPQTFGAGYIRCEGPVQLTLYADGVQVNQATVSSGYFTIPDINGALRWSVKLSGAFAVYELQIARTLKELRNV